MSFFVLEFFLVFLIVGESVYFYWMSYFLRFSLDIFFFVKFFLILVFFYYLYILVFKVLFSRLFRNILELGNGNSFVIFLFLLFNSINSRYRVIFWC